MASIMYAEPRAVNLYAELSARANRKGLRLSSNNSEFIARNAQFQEVFRSAHLIGLEKLIKDYRKPRFIGGKERLSS